MEILLFILIIILIWLCFYWIYEALRDIMYWKWDTRISDEDDETKSELEKDIEKINKIKDNFKNLNSELFEIKKKYRKKLFNFLKK